MRQSKASRVLAITLGFILIGCLIQAAGQIKNDRLVFPDVTEILRAFFRLLAEPRTWLLIRTTMLHLLSAMAVSTLFGLIIGLAEGNSDFIRTMLRPLMVLLRSIPMLVLVVIIMVLTKYENVPLIGTSLILIPLISEAVSEGCRSIDSNLIDVYRLNSDLNLQVIWNVHLPLMTGYLKQAYISAIGMGIKLVVSTEYLVQTKNSLGKAINTSIYFNEYQDIYAYALIMVLLVVLISELPLWLIRLAGKNGDASSSSSENN